MPLCEMKLPRELIRKILAETESDVCQLGSNDPPCVCTIHLESSEIRQLYDEENPNLFELKTKPIINIDILQLLRCSPYRFFKYLPTDYHTKGLCFFGAPATELLVMKGKERNDFKNTFNEIDYHYCHSPAGQLLWVWCNYTIMPGETKSFADGERTVVHRGCFTKLLNNFRKEVWGLPSEKDGPDLFDPDSEWYCKPKP